jgi:predicted aconitase
MKLNEEEKAMLAGECGPVRKIAIEHQIKVGEFFGAKDLVPVSQAHIMADTESLGESGVEWLESLAKHSRKDRAVRIPTITDPRGTDFTKAKQLGQTEKMLELERRVIDAFVKMGVSMTDTCINYQTIMAPVFGEHLAFGDTGVVIYSNSVCGARSNFEGGPSALAAGLTGRTPRYGYHLDEHRKPTHRFKTAWTPQTLNEWGALGGLIGKKSGNYWSVPVLDGVEGHPGSDAMKHFGAAMASFGSTALFHILGVTPEALHARDLEYLHLPEVLITKEEVMGLQSSYRIAEEIDVVVFSAPQLSLIEMKSIAQLCEGKKFIKPLLAMTSPQVKPDSDRMGYTQMIESAGGTVFTGMCFYQSYAREIAEANGWKVLATNSAKIVNILGGYGYTPMLASMEDCVQAAVTGRLN